MADSPLPDVLIGRLDADGAASLQVDSSISSPTSLNGGERISAMKAALRDATNSTGNNSSADSETPSDEDYDTLTPDHEAILPNGADKSSHSVSEVPQEEHEAYEALMAGNNRPAMKRMRSIPIILKKADKKGRYLLKADDVELRRLLKMGMERV